MGRSFIHAAAVSSGFVRRRRFCVGAGSASSSAESMHRRIASARLHVLLVAMNCTFARCRASSATWMVVFAIDVVPSRARMHGRARGRLSPAPVRVHHPRRSGSDLRSIGTMTDPIQVSNREFLYTRWHSGKSRLRCARAAREFTNRHQSCWFRAAARCAVPMWYRLSRATRAEGRT